jgi:proteasome lid subunit RPN8/RPN11
MSGDIELSIENVPLKKNYAFYLAQDGRIYLRKENFLYSAILPVDAKKLRLSSLKENIELRIKKKIPYGDVKRIEALACAVEQRYKKEILIIPMFHPGKENYRFFIPHQTAAAAYVRSEEPILEQDGYVPIGSIHSHVNCSAFHSAGDIEDERNNSSGVHMTVGDLDKENPTWVASLVVNGKRQKLDPEDILEFSIDYPEEWIQKLALDYKVDEICGR